MILVKFITVTKPENVVAVSTMDSLFSLIWILDESDDCIVWTIVDAHPADFGWGKEWKKYVEKFTPEHFKKCW